MEQRLQPYYKHSFYYVPQRRQPSVKIPANKPKCCYFLKAGILQSFYRTVFAFIGLRVVCLKIYPKLAGGYYREQWVLEVV
jgi:hypothetical protein